MNQFSIKSGIHASIIGRYMKGITEPTEATLKKFSSYFGIPVVELRGEAYGAILSPMLLDNSKASPVTAGNFELNKVITLSMDKLIDSIKNEIPLDPKNEQRIIIETTKLFMSKMGEL